MFRTKAALAAAVTVAAGGASAAFAATGQESVDEAAFLSIVNSLQTSTIQAQFTVPAVNCTTTGGIEDATAQVGALGGLGQDRRMEARTGSGAAAIRGLVTVRADVMGGCVGTSAVYQAQALGVPLAMTVTPGDKVLLTASLDPATQQETATVDDLTTGVTLTRTKQDNGQFDPFSDFAGVRRVKRDPVPDFGTIHWSKVRINGAPIGSGKFLFGFSLISSIAQPRLLIRTSPLSKAGDAFTNTWVASS